MSDGSRLQELRRRVQKDPASLVFGQLAEEYRRAGDYEEAVTVCRAGLTLHPGYLSARVTLGRALASLGHLDAAQRELEAVLRIAPENLAAIKGLADIDHQRRETADALRQAEAAVHLALHGPELEQIPVYPHAPGESKRNRALQTIARLERWLVALHGTRAHRRT